MEETEPQNTIWTRFKCWTFMKIGQNLWRYIVYHDDVWGKLYGVTFTSDRYFLKKFKYDSEKLSDDLEEEITKKEEKG